MASIMERLDARYKEVADYCAKNPINEVTKRAPEHMALYADAKERIAELEAELRKWLDIYARSEGGLTIAVPVYQIERLLNAR